MLFLSSPVTTSAFDGLKINKLFDNEILLKSVLLSLIIDMILIVLFILQHSLMKSEFVKRIWASLGLGVAERSIYNLASSFCLLVFIKTTTTLAMKLKFPPFQYLVQNWKTVPSFVLWKIDLNNSSTLWWAFVLTHGLAWFVVYGGSLLMDLSEILGIKQVYYDCNKLSSPMSYKSTELRRLYGHIRHPSFLGISTVLWATNCMSLDRLLLAVMWTAYMYISWNTTGRDCLYQKEQLLRKKYELNEKFTN